LPCRPWGPRPLPHPPPARGQEPWTSLKPSWPSFWGPWGIPRRWPRCTRYHPPFHTSRLGETLGNQSPSTFFYARSLQRGLFQNWHRQTRALARGRQSMPPPRPRGGKRGASVRRHAPPTCLPLPAPPPRAHWRGGREQQPGCLRTPTPGAPARRADDV